MGGHIHHAAGCGPCRGATTDTGARDRAWRVGTEGTAGRDAGLLPEAAEGAGMLKDRVTSAMQAGIADHVGAVEEITGLLGNHLSRGDNHGNDMD
jgi:hypothetical protein